MQNARSKPETSLCLVSETKKWCDENKKAFKLSSLLTNASARELVLVASMYGSPSQQLIKQRSLDT